MAPDADSNDLRFLINPKRIRAKWIAEEVLFGGSLCFHLIDWLLIELMLTTTDYAINPNESCYTQKYSQEWR